MAEEIDLETCNFRTSEAQRPWPSPWIGSRSYRYAQYIQVYQRTWPCDCILKQYGNVALWNLCNIGILWSLKSHVSFLRTKFKWPYFRSAWCYSHMVGQAASPICTAVCRYDHDPIQGQGQGHGPIELPTVAHNCTFLDLAPPFSRGAQKWWLLVIIWDLLYSLSESDFGISL